MVKLIAFSAFGLCSRRCAQQWRSNGKVKCSGQANEAQVPVKRDHSKFATSVEQDLHQGAVWLRHEPMRRASGLRQL